MLIFRTKHGFQLVSNITEIDGFNVMPFFFWVRVPLESTEWPLGEFWGMDGDPKSQGVY